MKVCAFCKKEIEAGRYFTRKSTCPHCGGDLHCCLNCGFYSESSHNKCLEPKAEFQRTRDKANFCDYFQLGQQIPAPGSVTPGVGGRAPGSVTPAEGSVTPEKARKKFEELFKK